MSILDRWMTLSAIFGSAHICYPADGSPPTARPLEPPRVEIEHAILCLDYMADQLYDGEAVFAPEPILKLVARYTDCNYGSPDFDTLRRATVVAEAVIAIQAWLDSDYRSCVAMLGPGLGLEQ